MAERNRTCVQVTALDAIVNVNTLFTGIVFIGISFSGDSDRDKKSCSGGPEVAKRLVLFEVISFSFFLFSSLLAQGLKIHINLINSSDPDEPSKAMVDKRVLNSGVIGSGVGSLAGCVFLMLSMVDVIQLRLGMLSCGNKYSVPAASALVVLVSFGLFIHLFTVGHGFLDQRRRSSASLRNRE